MCKWWNSLWYPRTPTITGEFKIFRVNNKIILIEEIEYLSVDLQAVKYKISDGTELTYDQALNVIHNSPKKPWIWIGDEDGTDMTEELNAFIVDGNLITLDLLNVLFPEIKNWKYCSRSFDILDFPSEILIKNDPINETSEKTS
jgi:hypothetical protein